MDIIFTKNKRHIFQHYFKQLNTMNKLYTIAVLTALFIYIPFSNARCCHDNKERTIALGQTTIVEKQHEQHLVEQQMAEQERIEAVEQQEINDIQFGIVENGKYDFIDKKCDFVTEPKLEYAIDFCNGVAYVKVNGKLGCIDKTGNYIVVPRFAPVWSPITSEGE